MAEHRCGNLSDVYVELYSQVTFSLSVGSSLGVLMTTEHTKKQLITC